LRRAKTEDLTEVSGIGCLYQSGTDKFGRPVVVFVGKWFNFNEINLDKVNHCVGLGLGQLGQSQVGLSLINVIFSFMHRRLCYI
jgi:hypothetical protein